MRIHLANLWIEPADNFSNFALHLAAIYKASDISQTTIASYFNRMYDLAQGKKAATIFEEADTTQYPLAEVIKQIFDIDYKPAKNGNNDVTNGGADVALRNHGSQGGESGGEEPYGSGEQNPTGIEPSERGAGTSGDSRALELNANKFNRNIPSSKVEQRTTITRIIDFAKKNKDKVGLSRKSLSFQTMYKKKKELIVPTG